MDSLPRNESASPEGPAPSAVQAAASDSAATERGATFVLERSEHHEEEARALSSDPPLPASFLIDNALWFCKLRWIAISALAAFGVLGLVLGSTEAVGLVFGSTWLLTMASVLAVVNYFHLRYARKLRGTENARGARLNLWIQMVLDLIAATVVVHFLGSLETYAPFLYLFHIVLSCMFFSRRESLAVVVVSSGLLLGCIGLETAGVLEQSSVFDLATSTRHSFMEPASMINIFSVIGMWVVVWHMASSLSHELRHREGQLVAINEKLVNMQEERTRHMLHTTHELKAPFAAIQANTQLLYKGYCGEMNEDAMDVLGRISARCEQLSREICEMLQFANLQAADPDSHEVTEVPLDEMAKRALQEHRQVADARGIEIEEDCRPVKVRIVGEHLRVLLDNLISNAINYSKQGGNVRVECRADGDGSPELVVRDRGVGIPPEKLPKIFDEYYRTDEAKQLNKRSSGLGLAIVKHIVETSGALLRVHSIPGEGTTFALSFKS